MTGLRISADLELPIEMVTEPFGVLANRGRGKSYATHAMVEEIHDAGVPVVVLDVKGDWWGLRYSADGKRDGLPFYIFGGDHSDLPLEPTAGELLADLVVDQRVSVVLDLSLMSKTKQRSFTVAFAERLYHRNREAMFLVVDEADVLIPQRATADTARLLGAMEDIAKRGRGRGIGVAVVTQRPQEVAKSVLDLMETLLLLGMTGPRSLKSVREWIGVHVDEDTAASTVMANLPGMQVGEAYVWSPLHGILKTSRIRQLRTFDSHVTPKPGEKRRTPQHRTDLDLDALGEQIAATVEKAKATDPKALQARIRELEARCRDLESTVVDLTSVEPEPVEPTIVHVPALTKEVLSDLNAATTPLIDLLQAMQAELARLEPPTGLPQAGNPGQPTTPSSARRATSTSSTSGRAPDAGPATTREKNPPAARETRPVAAGGPSKPQLKILDALAWFEVVGIFSPTRGQIAFQARVSPKSSGFEKNCSTLRTNGFIDYPAGNCLALTSDGRSLASWPDRPGTSEDLQQAFYDGVSKPQAAILQALVLLYPGEIDRRTLAESLEVSAVSSGFEKNLSTLRSLGLIDYPSPGYVVATDLLFVEGR